MPALFDKDRYVVESKWRTVRDFIYLRRELLPPRKSLPDVELVAQARTIWPLRIEREDHQLSFIDPGDIIVHTFYQGSFLQSSRIRWLGDAPRLALHGYMVTLHERPTHLVNPIGAPGYFFFPRAGEILAQMPMQDCRGVVGYECAIFGNDTGRDSLLFVESPDDKLATRAFYVGLTTLYAGELPASFADRPIMCGGKRYEPSQPKVAA